MRPHRSYPTTVLPLLFGVAALLGWVTGCDDSFSPSPAFHPRMVVYSVLTTESDTQYVRIYTTYDPPDNDPSKHQDEDPVTDAIVRISSDRASYQFQKIIVERPDKSWYPSGTVAYASYAFRPGRGTRFTLLVSSPTLGNVTATTTVPSVARVSPVKTFCLSNPYLARGETYGIETNLSSQAKGFLARIYVAYLVPTTQGGWQPKRREVPIVMKPSNMRSVEFIYPTVQRKQSFDARYPDTQAFRADGWIDLLDRVIAVEDGRQLIFVRALFQVIQFDAPLYDAYSVASYFTDRNSIRLDERDYTNVYGGAGVFGSLAVDSSVIGLPQDILR